jgi:thiol-disulfide isomerase/thioredoxin
MPIVTELPNILVLIDDMIEELAEDNLEELIKDQSLVLVQYSAGWCGNCRIMKPKFKKFSSEMESVSFYIVDSEKFPNSRKLAKVDNLPTFACFRNGVCTGQIQTNKSDVLKNFIDEASSN